MPAKKKSSNRVRTGKSEIREVALWRRIYRNFPLILLFIALVIIFLDGQFGIIGPGGISGQNGETGDDAYYAGLYNTEAPLMDSFYPTVLYWEEAIHYWSDRSRLNPNLIAILIQIESCGDPYAESPGVGAQGLFQVIPYYHFEDGENQLNPQTNAEAGLSHMQDCLNWAEGYGSEQIGLAFACYNAGPSVIGQPQSNWDPQAQYYYDWGTGIWAEVESGTSGGNTVARWLNAGGRRLCEDAEYWQQLLDPIEDWRVAVSQP